MASGHLLLSCAKRAATTKIDLFAYLWQLPCALCSLILMTLLHMLGYQQTESRAAKISDSPDLDYGRDASARCFLPSHGESPAMAAFRPHRLRKRAV